MRGGTGVNSRARKSPDCHVNTPKEEIPSQPLHQHADSLHFSLGTSHGKKRDFVKKSIHFYLLIISYILSSQDL